VRDLKYYLYVSDSKLAMLYDQMPENTRSKLATELKIDLKLISATVKKGEGQQNQFSKLRLLTEYLNESGEVGSIEFPGKYFAGSLPMRWGIWGEDWSPPEQRIVYFTGVAGETTVGLGGSPEHMIGPGRKEPVLDSMGGKSNLLRILSALSKEPELSSRLQRYQGFEAERAALAITQSVDKLPGPAQSLEFLAKSLMTGPGVLLGTPLYVALAE
jgi:hypothetical protein